MPRILIIEDMPDMRRNLVTILEMENYEVVSVDDGARGIAEARRHPPDLVLCDVMMPVLDGYGVLKALREDPRTAAIPFIFLTAKGDRRDVRAGMNLGADDYLAKPVTVSELLGAVQARLDRAAAQSPPRDGSSGSLDDGREAFTREGEFWTIGRGDEVIRLRDVRGLHMLATLLAAPGKEFHCLELEGVEDPGIVGAGDAGAHLDQTARAQYRQRLRELGEELEEARAHNDVGRVERLDAEVDTLSAELSRAFGLGGRERRAGSATERARVNVTRLLLGAVRKIGGLHPRLGEHLTASIKTGNFCRYQPDPASPVRWRL